MKPMTIMPDGRIFTRHPAAVGDTAVGCKLTGPLIAIHPQTSYHHCRMWLKKHKPVEIQDNPMNATKPLEQLIQELPPSLRHEVQTFVEFLLTTRQPTQRRKLRQDWAGELRAEGVSSVELQHLALAWREE